MDKLIAITDELNSIDSDIEPERAENLSMKIITLQDAFDYAEHPDKFANENKRHETMLNAYYIMNNQELPKDYIENEEVIKKSLEECKTIHDRKKEERETEYLGYFYKEAINS